MMEVIQDRIKLSVTKQEYEKYYDNWKDMIDGFGHSWYVEQLTCDSSVDPIRPVYYATLKKCYL